MLAFRFVATYVHYYFIWRPFIVIDYAIVLVVPQLRVRFMYEIIQVDLAAVIPANLDFRVFYVATRFSCCWVNKGNSCASFVVDDLISDLDKTLVIPAVKLLQMVKLIWSMFFSLAKTNLNTG